MKDGSGQTSDIFSWYLTKSLQVLISETEEALIKSHWYADLGPFAVN